MCPSWKRSRLWLSAAMLPMAFSGLVMADELSEPNRVQTVSDVLEKPGVLTPRGVVVFDTGFSYAQNTSNKIDVIGYTVLPALLVGLIQANDEERTTLTLGLGMRYGFTNRFEGEIRVPFIAGFVERSTSNFNNTGDGEPESQNSSFNGYGIGDVEVAFKYQFNVDKPPYWVGGLRYKSTTGQNPYEIDLDDDVPTGSGFHSIEPNLTLIQPLAPAVLFMNISYIYNFEGDYDVKVKRSDGTDAVDMYEVRPGDSIALRAGMGFAVNPDLSFSLGLSHRTILESDIKINGEKEDSSMLQLDSINFGVNYRFSPATSMNIVSTAGLTEDSPDFQLSFNLTKSF
ncbi:transporter [Parasalinivibrio latis]|uniref:transporter n=1 Tax=Parasalinivibrio latis TaxID=2952610 RepID=UPI0030E37CFE